MTYQLSKHARTRVRQRGFRKTDVDIVLYYGTAGIGGRYMLTNRDADEAIREGSFPLSDIERVRNCALVFEDGIVVTMYHCTSPTLRRALGIRKR